MNLIKLAVKPNEYFEESKEGEIQKREPIKLRYLFIALIIFSVLSFVVEKMVIPELELEQANVFQIPTTVFTILQYIGCTVFPLITAWIFVNILYLVNKVLISSVENKEIEEKKYFKSLLYFRYIVVSIATMILGTISVLILKNSDSLVMISAINNLFIKLWATYILFGILKYYVQTKKLHKILPTILYIFTIIGTAFIIYVNTLMSGFAV